MVIFSFFFLFYGVSCPRASFLLRVVAAECGASGSCARRALVSVCRSDARFWCLYGGHAKHGTQHGVSADAAGEKGQRNYQLLLVVC